ncbi:hypothetical protein B0H15DRAFT_493643 [Mycena belliarum]|uniref:Uncharacterized protein n=1 Tax=Mycena belliarum TaxID=1033014 RepID=A0AAD6TU17_9AGAR|nr:hypothetical protein B0H15DRAFT_493643 [Mycena belliae]
MVDKLIEAIETDLDRLLPTNQQLKNALESRVSRLADDWEDAFGDKTSCTYKDTENGTNEASELLLQTFLIKTFEAIQATSPAPGPEQLKFSVKEAARDAKSFRIDNTIHLASTGKYILGMKDKPANLLPQAVAQLVRRGLSCGVVEVEEDVSQDQDQPNWWIVANKGALYAAAYNVDWVIVGSVTAYCVGLRTDGHMLWSPTYNRRNWGDEASPENADPITNIFESEAAPAGAQTGLLLLLLPVVLKGLMGQGCPGSRNYFPSFIDSRKTVH